MIARVRIAPIEQWCGNAKDALSNNPKLALLQGAEIEILTDDMLDSSCDGEKSKRWRMTLQTVERLTEIAGFIDGNYVSRCMLEMD